jgi:hypothetical protein
MSHRNPCAPGEPEILPPGTPDPAPRAAVNPVAAVLNAVATQGLGALEAFVQQPVTLPVLGRQPLWVVATGTLLAMALLPNKRKAALRRS